MVDEGLIGVSSWSNADGLNGIQSDSPIWYLHSQNWIHRTPHNYTSTCTIQIPVSNSTGCFLLISYGKALFIVQGKKRDDMSGLKEAYNNVWICSGLLKKTASSLTLCQHLQSCKKWLTVPINTEKLLKQYQAYMGFHQNGCHDPTPDNPGHLNDIDLPLDESEELDEWFLQWIHLQAIHWLLLGTLSRFFGSPSYNGVKLGITFSL